MTGSWERKLREAVEGYRADSTDEAPLRTLREQGQGEVATALVMEALFRDSAAQREPYTARVDQLLATLRE